MSPAPAIDCQRSPVGANLSMNNSSRAWETTFSVGLLKIRTEFSDLLHRYFRCPLLRNKSMRKSHETSASHAYCAVDAILCCPRYPHPG
jgi:hypothetical protein